MTMLDEISFVYVMGPKRGPQKIGRARDPDLRLAGLQVGHPRKLFVAYRAPMSQSDAATVEKRCHRLLAAKRTGGEWFRVTAAEAEAMVRSVVKDLSAPAPQQMAVRRVSARGDTIRQLYERNELSEEHYRLALAYRQLARGGAWCKATARNEEAMAARLDLQAIHADIRRKLGPSAVFVLANAAVASVPLSKFLKGGFSSPRLQRTIERALDVAAPRLAA